MDQYQTLIEIIALSMGVAWASGINLYAVLLVLGLGSASGYVDLPEQLAIVENPAVIGAAGLMYMVEFVADKTPGVDSIWDSLHTLVRIPAGALLAAGAVGDVDPALAMAAAIVGGGVAASSHLTKSGSRVLINTSPEPASNWIASLAEDIAAVGAVWLALSHPWLAVLFLVLILLLTAWLLPRLLRAIRKLFSRIRDWFRGHHTENDRESPPQTFNYSPPPNLDALNKAPLKTDAENKTD